MKFNEFLGSKLFKWSVIGVGEFILLLLVFKGGMDVGFRKAGFSYRMGEKYFQVFGNELPPPPRGGMGRMPGDDLLNAFSASGVVLKIENNGIFIRSENNTEKEIIFSSSTLFRRQRQTISYKDVGQDDLVSVIGSPNSNGQIEAKFIRVMNP